MNARMIGVCVGLALAVTAVGQPQEFLMVPRQSPFEQLGNGAVLLFNAHDGSLVNPTFIPGGGAQYAMAFSTAAVQVGNEIWISDQLENVLFRFDLLGNFIGTVYESMANTRGMAVHDGTVYVCNGSSNGSTPANSIAKYDMTGTYLGAFSVGTFPWGIMSHEGSLLVSHTGANGINRWSTDGFLIGAFHTPGAVRTPSQLNLKSNGNIIAAGNGAPAGLYEYDTAGEQVSVISVTGPRGVHQLGNGNLLYTNSAGVHVYDVNASASTLVTSAPSSMYIGRLSFDPSASGACCLPSGSCQVLSMSDCGSQGGIYRGADTTCATAACPQPGACCLGDGSCSLQQPDACRAASGVWYGPGSTCAAGACLTVLRAPTSNWPSGSHVAPHGAGIFMDWTAASQDLLVREIDYFPVQKLGAPVVVDIWTRPGSHVGFTGDPDGWTLTQTISATSTTTGISTSSSGTINPTRLKLSTPIAVPAGQTVGVYFVGSTGGVRYRIGTSGVQTFSNSDLTFFANTVRGGPPFFGTVATPRSFAGAIFYSVETGPTPCYANCDGSTQPPILNVADFTCFLQKFAAGDPYANCDESTQPPVLNVADFTCFLQKFAAGCP